MENIFAVYKPRGITSHDVIDILRTKLDVRRIGHAGTLDPLARGVLVVGVGRDATKRLSRIVKKEKEYIATVKLGETSTTDDTEGEKVKNLKSQISNLKEIQRILREFTGEIMQTPPAYSAVRIHGKRSYTLAREGKVPDLRERKVTIKAIDVLEYRWPILMIRVVTGPGVYIRALARDVGQKLGCGAYLSDLERVRVGDFTKDSAMRLDRPLRPEAK
jgi:tRNA pseudouridine55 synthase